MEKIETLTLHGKVCIGFTNECNGVMCVNIANAMPLAANNNAGASASSSGSSINHQSKVKINN